MARSPSRVRMARERLSDLFWRRPGVLLALLLAPPLLWLGVVYLGSLFALLAQSFFSIDEFSGVVDRELTLKTYAELLRPANLDIIVRTVAMAAAVTLASIVVAFPIAYYAARYARGRWKALFYLGVMLPLWSSYLVKIYAWKMILAKEGIVSWAPAASASAGCSTACSALPVIGGPSLSVSYLGTFLVFVYVWLPFMILPMQASLERVPASLIEASGDLGAGAAPDLPPRHPAAGDPRRRRRLDLHLLADARRLHHPADHRQLGATTSAWRSTSTRAPPGTSRSPPPSRWCRSSIMMVYLWFAEAHGGLRCALTAARPSA